MATKDARVSYKDSREWMKALEEEGQLVRVTQQVDWKYELATILRRTWDIYGDASPALLFENIKDRYGSDDKKSKSPNQPKIHVSCQHNN